MTGRKGRVVSNDDGSISYESRSELDVPVEILNLTEKQRFMDGDKVCCFGFTHVCVMFCYYEQHLNGSMFTLIEHRNYLRGCQLWYFSSSRPQSEESEEEGTHDIRATLEC